MTALAERVGIKGAPIASCKAGLHFQLLDTEGYVVEDDPRIGELARLNDSRAGHGDRQLRHADRARRLPTGPVLMSLPKPRPGVMDIAPYVGGQHSVDGVEDDHRARVQRDAARAQPERDRGLSIRRRAPCTAIPTATRRSCAARSAGNSACDKDRIVCGAGSDELIQLLIRAYAGPGDEVLYSRHGFLDVPHLRDRRRRHAGGRAGEGDLTADVDALLVEGDRAHAAGLPRQSEQPDRQLPADGRAAAAARRPAASTSCW